MVASGFNTSNYATLNFSRIFPVKYLGPLVVVKL